MTPLLIACKKKYRDIISIYIDAGADPNVADAAENTALLLAIKGGDQTNINLVLESSCNVMEPNNKGASDYRTLSG